MYHKRYGVKCFHGLSGCIGVRRVSALPFITTIVEFFMDENLRTTTPNRVIITIEWPITHVRYAGTDLPDFTALMLLP